MGEDQAKGTPLIRPGRVMEKAINVNPGQKVSWSFRVAKPQEVSKGRSLLGSLATLATSMVETTDIVFSVNAIWLDKTLDEIPKIAAKVRSAGCGHGDAAEFWVEGKKVDFDVGVGVNVLALNPSTKEPILKSNYDTTDDKDAANENLVSDIKALPQASIVLLAIKGTGAESITEDTFDVLRSVGATITNGHYHKGYALIGCKGSSQGGPMLAETMDHEVIVEADVPTIEMEAELVEPRSIVAEAAATTGTTETIERKGLIVLRFSNFHSFVNSKVVTDVEVNSS